MRNFVRAMKLSVPYWFRLFLSVFFAFCIAILWSLNLSALFPILKILVAEPSREGNLQAWVNHEIAEHETKATDPIKEERIVYLRTVISNLNLLPPSDDRDQELRDRTKELAKLEANQNYHRTWQSRYQFLKTAVVRHMPVSRFETFVWLMGIFFFAVALRGVLEYFQEMLVGSVVCRTLFDFRNRLYRNLIHQDTRQITGEGTSEIMSRATNDIEQVGMGMKILYGKMVLEPLRMFAFIICALFISWQLTLLFVVLVPPALITLSRVSRKMKKAAKKVLQRMSTIFKILRETFDGIRVVKAFTMEPAERRRFRKATEEYYERSMRVVRIDAFTGPMVELFGVFGIGIALIAGAYLVLEGQTHITLFGMRFKMVDEPMGFETLVTLYAFLASIADPVRKLSTVYTKIQTGAVAADRVFALSDREPTVTTNVEGPVVPPHSETIEFKNVCFSYVPGHLPGTLNNIDLSVTAGETIAIVGPNGCGKSTLLGLLARFYDPDHGAIFVDGVNLRHGKLRSLRKQIGLVTQDTMLFNDTILHNIAYGRHGATREEVEAAAKQAFAHEFIIGKPAGYEEIVGDLGSQLSGGQKQRIALARAIVRNPRILILDEFTSQIDTESEVKIHQALREFVKGRTTFIVTHRASTLELANRIVVMNQGKMVAVGHHAELIKTCTMYQRLYEAHFQSGDGSVESEVAASLSMEENRNGIPKAG